MRPYDFKDFLVHFNRFTSSVYQQNSEWQVSGYHLREQGILLDASFDSVPLVRHNVQWEGVWRELNCHSRATTFPVREQAGHSVKSSLRHVIHFDNRDSTVFSTRGSLFRMVQELAGLGGDAGFVKHEVNYQMNLPIATDVVIQGTFHGGLMKRLNDEKLIYICDRFFLGGPHTVRGFNLRGIGPHSDGQALGAQVLIKPQKNRQNLERISWKDRFLTRHTGVPGCTSSRHCPSGQVGAD